MTEFRLSTDLLSGFPVKSSEMERFPSKPPLTRSNFSGTCKTDIVNRLLSNRVFNCQKRESSISKAKTTRLILNLYNRAMCNFIVITKIVRQSDHVPALKRRNGS